MGEPVLRFHFHEPEVDTNRPIVESRVRIEGFDLQIVPADAEYDVWEVGSSSLPGMLAAGEAQYSIPVWPNRKFRLGYIFVNSAAGVEHPRDLEGKRVALAGWGNPAGVWAKGALQNSFGVDLTKIHWFAPRPDATPVPPEVHIQDVDRRDLDAMLVSGELDAVIEPNVLPSITNRDPRVRRLFRDYKAEEQKYWRETGIFPISHVVTLKRRFVEQYPHAPVALLEAYRKARDVAFQRVIGSDPEYLILTWASALVDEQRALMGENYWPYNLVDNRRTLEALTRFACQQGLTAEQVDYEQFFHPEAAAHPGA